MRTRGHPFYGGREGVACASGLQANRDKDSRIIR